jgi:uncharacterized membrane protein
MDYATTDLVLAIVHHLLVFMLAGILAFEIGTVSLIIKRDEILRVGRVDNWYGILAGVESAAAELNLIPTKVAHLRGAEPMAVWTKIMVASRCP